MRPAEFDFETYSEAGFVWDAARNRWVGPPGASKNQKGLSVVGAAVYAEHPSTEILTLSYALPPLFVTKRWRPGQALPQDLFDYVASGAPIEAHNAFFEFAIWHLCAVRKYGWPATLRHGQMRCTMATARVNSLPGALAQLSEVLKLPTPKDAAGKKILDRVSVPQNPTKKDARLRITRDDDPALFEGLDKYCDTDLDAERGVAMATVPMSEDELFFWTIDQEINYRGIGVDRAGLDACRAVLGQVLDVYGEEHRQLTGFDATQLAEVRGWLAAQGVYTDSLDADHVEALLERDDLPPAARRAVEIRALTGSASVKKLYAMTNMLNSDSRLRNLIVHHGARTGRPTGEGPQPLNLPKAGPDLKWCICGRPYAKSRMGCPWCGEPLARLRKDGSPDVSKWCAEAVDHALEIMAFKDMSLVELFFGDALLTISGCLRGLFQAGPGMELIASDYSAIEAVVLAMLAGEQWRIDAFRENKPIYLLGASKITGRSLEEYLAYKDTHGDHHPDRQTIGKVSELACFSRRTQVLTNCGYVGIADVTDKHLLWDGHEWVRSAGSVKKGIRTVLRLDGVEVTPDHKINCKGFWREASRLVSNANTLSLALGTGSESLQSLSRNMEKEVVSSLSSSSALAARNLMELIPTISETVKVQGVTLALKRLQALTSKGILNTRRSSPMTKPVDALLTEFQAAWLAAIIQKTPGMKTTADGGSRFTNRGVEIGRRFSHIWSRWTAGMSRCLNWIEQTLTVDTSRETFGSSQRKKITITADRYKTSSANWTGSEAVYDIALAGPRNRFTIKTDSGHMVAHNCGFGGWVGSYIAFGSTEPEDVIKRQILAWRAASPAIVEFWGGQFRGRPWDHDSRQEYFGVEGHFILARLYPGQVFTYKGIQFFTREYEATGTAVIIRLLSGRELTYHGVVLAAANRQYSRPGELCITYMTYNTNPKYGPKGWVRMDTYGGRLTENIVQATAHDILRYGIVLLRHAGYPTVLHVYDEVCLEVPEGAGSVEEVERLMSTMPPWAADWPVRAAGGWRGKRYRKA